MRSVEPLGRRLLLLSEKRRFVDVQIPSAGDSAGQGR